MDRPRVTVPLGLLNYSASPRRHNSRAPLTAYANSIITMQRCWRVPIPGRNVAFAMKLSNALRSVDGNFGYLMDGVSGNIARHREMTATDEPSVFRDATDRAGLDASTCGTAAEGHRKD